MAAPEILILEAVNLFCGDHDPTQSKHLTLAELKLPTWQKKLEEHHPGGAPVAIEIALGMEKLESTFKLVGWDPALLTQFGLGDDESRRYTAYGALRNKQTGKIKKAVAVMEASLGKVESDNYKRGELHGHEYGLNEIMHYELKVAGEEVFYWDFFTNTLRIDGRDKNAKLNRALGIA